MPLPEARDPIVLGHKKSNVVKLQGKDLKTAIAFQDYKEDMNKCLNEDHDDKQLNGTMKAAQDVRVEFIREIELLKHTLNNIRKEKPRMSIKNLGDKPDKQMKSPGRTNFRS